MSLEQQFAEELFGCSPINPVSCKNCRFVIGPYRSARCQVYPRSKPDEIYCEGKPCPYQKPLEGSQED